MRRARVGTSDPLLAWWLRSCRTACLACIPALSPPQTLAAAPPPSRARVAQHEHVILSEAFETFLAKHIGSALDFPTDAFRASVRLRFRAAHGECAEYAWSTSLVQAPNPCRGPSVRAIVSRLECECGRGWLERVLSGPW